MIFEQGTFNLPSMVVHTKAIFFPLKIGGMKVRRIVINRIQDQTNTEKLNKGCLKYDKEGGNENG